MTIKPKRTIIKEGKAKILYEGPDPETIIQHFKDDATAFNGEKHATISGKGVLNNRISEFLMQNLNMRNIPTHFIKTLNMREQLIQNLEMIPLEVVMRNIAAGSLVKRLGVEHGRVLPRPIMELYYKNDALNDPLISDEHALVLGYTDIIELEEIKMLSFRICDFLSGLFTGVGLRLVDFKMEFGRLITDEGISIVLGDEISPDTCRLWDIKTNEILDKDRFRQDLGGVAEAYQEVAKRLGLIDKVTNLGN